MSDIFSDRDNILRKRREELEQLLKEKEKKADQYSRFRVIFFLLSAVFLGLLIGKNEKTIFFILLILGLVAFFVMVFFHTIAKRACQKVRLLLLIHEEHEKRVLHDFSMMKDTGADFSDRTHDFSSDLDLFGESSLFHIINVGCTWHGRTRLFSLLSDFNKRPVEIGEVQKRQRSVRELSENLPWIEELQCAARISGQEGKDPEVLISFAKGEKESAGIKKPMLFVFFLLSFSLVVTAILSGLFQMMSVLVPFSIFCVQILITAFSYRKNRISLESVDNFYKEISSYKRLFQLAEGADFSDSGLRNICNLFTSSENGISASGKIKKLGTLSGFVHLRSQPLFFVILNTLFLFDFYCLFFLDKWQKENGKDFEMYLEALGELEALSGLSMPKLIFPFSVLPELKEGDEPVFQAKDMGHPLIPATRLIRNSFSLEGGTALITGSNMSGKTTLLRTVGINMILSYAGSYVCASSLSLTVMRLGSSMRIADNLGEGLSTFYAELIRIGTIIKKAEEGFPLLFLIDEIFRGTNSQDRTDGALLVLKKLSGSKMTGLMSTHDYALCLSEDAKALPLSHYHFSESYDDAGIHFDYKLQDGISISSNARYLMKLMGIE